MSAYQAPLKDITFTLNQICDLEGLLSLTKFAETDKATTEAVLEEAGKLASGIFRPQRHYFSKRFRTQMQSCIRRVQTTKAILQ